MAKTTEMESQGIVNTIMQGTEIKGNIVANGDFRMDGNLEGDIKLNGRLVVGENGTICGNIECQNANIIGKVFGNILVKDLLCLSETAMIKGDIVINKLSVEPGAEFVGTCKMYQEGRGEVSNIPENTEGK